MAQMELYTAAEVADRLRVRKWTVENLYRSGRLAGCKVGKHLRFRPDDVQRFIDGDAEKQRGRPRAQTR